ncbi:hypothetical protein TNCV_3568561 [Trichonephila clavipes]|nr:hypothetical protein TNCV_3568561 [Trichonephila clavipes]
MALVWLGLESNWVWMTVMGNSFHAVSNLCHTSTTVLAREMWRASLSTTHDQIFSMSDRSRDRARQGNNRIPCTMRKGPYTVIEYKQATSDRFGSSRHVYSYQNTVHRTGTLLKHDKVPSCIHLCRSAHQSHRLSLCYIVEGSRNNGRCADRPRCCKCRHSVRVDTGHVSNMPISLLFARDVAVRFCRANLTMSALSDVNHGRAWRSCMPFSMALRNPLIPYLLDGGWISFCTI